MAVTTSGKVQITIGAKLGASVKSAFGALRTSLARIGSLAKSALNFGKYMAIGGVAALTLAARQAMGFASAMDEVATLVDTNVVNMKELTREVKLLGVELGKDPAEVAKGLYQLISAGVDAGKAMEVMRVAAKAAVAGVAETEQSVNLLTNTINAYGLSVEDANKVADVAFETVRQGKTTYAELADQMGMVMPVAAQLNVGIEDLYGAVATLTKGGIDTASATTYLRQVLVSALQPTKEASDAAKKLGLDFSATAIKSKGLIGFLEDVKQKTKGDSEAISALFGNVRALTGALVLTGKGAEEYNRIVGKLTENQGAMNIAFEKIAGGDAKKAEATWNTLKVLFQDVGTAVLAAIAPMAEGATKWYVANEKLISQRLAEWAGAAAEKVGDLANWMTTGKPPEWLQSTIRWVRELIGGFNELKEIVGGAWTRGQEAVTGFVARGLSGGLQNERDRAWQTANNDVAAVMNAGFAKNAEEAQAFIARRDAQLSERSAAVEQDIAARQAQRSSDLRRAGTFSAGSFGGADLIGLLDKKAAANMQLSALAADTAARM